MGASLRPTSKKANREGDASAALPYSPSAVPGLLQPPGAPDRRIRGRRDGHAPHHSPWPRDDIRVPHAVAVAVETTAVVDHKILGTHEYEDVRPRGGVEDRAWAAAVSLDTVAEERVAARPLDEERRATRSGYLVVSEGIVGHEDRSEPYAVHRGSGQAVVVEMAPGEIGCGDRVPPWSSHDVVRDDYVAAIAHPDTAQELAARRRGRHDRVALNTGTVDTRLHVDAGGRPGRRKAVVGDNRVPGSHEERALAVRASARHIVVG